MFLISTNQHFYVTKIKQKKKKKDLNNNEISICCILSAQLFKYQGNSFIQKKLKSFISPNSQSVVFSHKKKLFTIVNLLGVKNQWFNWKLPLCKLKNYSETPVDQSFGSCCFPFFRNNVKLAAIQTKLE